MCGIAGFWHQGQGPADLGGDLRRMTDAIRHRGPDDAGQWCDTGAGVALGHRRLSILDLTPEGRQPMTSADGRYVIVYNGEVYNHAELRQAQGAGGVRYRGHSDTEVMLAAIQRQGLSAAVRSFVGMFAFALYDRAERTLHLARDRFGEKPLYWGWLGGTLVFGSELKALRRHPRWEGRIDRGALTLLLRYNYIPAPHAIYQGIRKVLPGTILSFRADAPGADGSSEAYWSAPAAAAQGLAAPLVGDETEVLAELEGALRRTVAQEMVADVPLGAFLSGGIDSSLIVALMQAQSARPVRTFTIGFHEQAYNEAEHAKAVAAHLGTDHTELYVTPAETLAVVPRLPTLYDEPFSDSSQVPTFLVSELARRHVTVSLSGDGGDELFGGYDRYAFAEHLWRRLRIAPRLARRAASRAVLAVPPDRWDRLLGALPIRPRGYRLSGDRLHKLARLFSVETPDQLYRRLLTHWHEPARMVVGGEEPPSLVGDPSAWPDLGDFTLRMMCVDQLTYLPDDILVKVDRASMGVSLESRAPFLDHRVAELAWRIPLAWKIRQGKGKWILRRLLARYVPETLFERPKMGFGVPIDSWLRGPLREWAGDLLHGSRLRSEGFLDPTAIEWTWEEHQRGDCNWQYLLWDVLMFQAWLEHERDGRRSAAA